MNHLPLTIVGNLTANPELRFTPAGVAVVKFTVAHNPRTLDKQSGEWRDGTATFMDCAAWRDLAEHVAESLRAGHRVIAYGHLVTQAWESDGRGTVEKGKTLTRMQLGVMSIGPDLTWATAEVRKAARGRGETAPDDPWATASKTRPATAAAAPAGRSFDDEPPF